LRITYTSCCNETRPSLGFQPHPVLHFRTPPPFLSPIIIIIILPFVHPSIHPSSLAALIILNGAQIANRLKSAKPLQPYNLFMKNEMKLIANMKTLLSEFIATQHRAEKISNLTLTKWNWFAGQGFWYPRRGSGYVSP